MEEPNISLSTAARPNNIEQVPYLLEEISNGTRSPANLPDEKRKELLLKCRSLLHSLQTPRETVVDHTWGQIGAISAITFGVDCGLWDLMAQNGDGAQKVGDLATSLGVNPKLLGRLMRHLATMGLLTEVGEDEYKTTNYTKCLSLPEIGHGYIGLTSCTAVGALKFHEFSRRRDWVNPSDAKDTSLMQACGTDMDVFSWVDKLGYLTQFNNYLAGYGLGRLRWFDPSVYPVTERLIDGADTDPDAAFLVDIGGNVGHDLARFRNAYPALPGKLILQDLPMMIDQVTDLDPEIVCMKHDFHNEQPVKGARAYYLHSTLHNWPDDTCTIILTQIKGAMKPGYSKLLINEYVVPKVGAYWETTGLDLMMMSLCSSEERTYEDWLNLLEQKVGLKVVHIWGAGKGVESLIECKLP
ncbi:O-methyltransferase family 2 [Penicillium angulare]|uniref:O-methyltransferase family 2 n=1 Tax=Penicillium angulare TaxID=116970 RepID=A0A9W9GEM9_9EURO|nr:O-methyltransferase family 2 [Penicillium angulare]